jgi:hypothetical protein
MNGKTGFRWVLTAALALVLLAGPAAAKEFQFAGKPLNLYGYVTQSLGYSLRGEHFDTEKDVQSAYWTLLFEGDYQPADTLKFYGQFIMAGDWIYDLKHDDRTWNNREFPGSRDRLSIDDQYWQIVKEVHATWTPPNFLFRVGKQIVAWGEMDGFRIMDQINPLDQRRGFADVEFETTIIPIWLVRADYYLPITSEAIQDMGFEFVFNPNASWIPNQDLAILTGNDVSGIWAVNFEFPAGPGSIAHLGSLRANIDHPDSFNSDGFEYAVRMKGVFWDNIITLNYFYGLDNSPVLVNVGPPDITVTPGGDLVMHPHMAGYFPRFRFAGATFSRDLSSLRADFLGGISPVVRLEGFYGFDNTFATNLDRFVQSDEIRWGIGVDWKVRIPLINPTQGISIMPQFYHRHLTGVPAEGLSKWESDTYEWTLMLKTSYMNAKLTPSFFILRDVRSRSHFIKMQLEYNQTNNWHYAVGVLLVEGSEPTRLMNDNLTGFENKDYMYFKVSYRWG